MNRKRDLLFLILCVLLITAIPLVSAGRETYNDDEPTMSYGTWDEDDFDATEALNDGSYRCVFTFIYYGIRTDGDDYYINIDYDGVNYGYPWNVESLDVEYRWGSDSWIHIAYCGSIAFDQDISITDATNSVLFLRFTDCMVTSDSLQHKWFFGDTPYVICDY